MLVSRRTAPELDKHTPMSSTIILSRPLGPNELFTTFAIACVARTGRCQPRVRRPGACPGSEAKRSSPFWSRMSEPEIFWPPRNSVPLPPCSKREAIVGSYGMRKLQRVSTRGSWKRVEGRLAWKLPTVLPRKFSCHRGETLILAGLSEGFENRWWAWHDQPLTDKLARRGAALQQLPAAQPSKLPDLLRQPS
jgi:hypothetical protein